MRSKWAGERGGEIINDEGIPRNVKILSSKKEKGEGAKGFSIKT